MERTRALRIILGTLLFGFCFSATPRPALEALDKQCLKVPWMTALSTTSTDSNRYHAQIVNTQRQYLLAVASAKLHSPSLLPIAILQGEDADEHFVSTLRELGVTILNHTAQFHSSADRRSLHVPPLLRSSCLFLDIHRIVDAMSQQLDRTRVDLDFVLWTDTDVVFMNDINACKLPKPDIISAGPGITKFDSTRFSFGVMYLNAKEFGRMASKQKTMACHAYQAFSTEGLHELIQDSIGHKQISVLPEGYDWKPFWGDPKIIVMGDQPIMHIVHYHDFDLSDAVCGLDHLQAMHAGKDSAEGSKKQASEDRTKAVTLCCRACQRRNCELFKRLLIYAFDQEMGNFTRKLQAGLDGIENGNKAIRGFVEKLGLPSTDRIVD